MNSNLQNALNFTTEDLQANRDGTLSERQRTKLQIAQQRSFRVLLLMGFVTVALLFGGFLIGGFAFITLDSIALLLAILALVEYLIGYRTYARDLTTPTIESAQGLLQYVQRGANNVLDTELRPRGIRVGDVQFLLMEDQALVFEVSHVYILYYAPATHTLLSAEQAFIHDDPMDGEIVYWEENAIYDEQKE